MISRVSCYSDLENYHAHEERHVGYLAMRAKLVATLGELQKEFSSPLRILEFGSGTGLLTQELVRFENKVLDLNEPDRRCRELLTRNISGDRYRSLSSCRFEELNGGECYDVIASTFAHDHIAEGTAAARSIFEHLAPGGYYLCGIELVRDYHSEQEHREALKLWHGYVIEEALKVGETVLAGLEEEALESGLKKVADFKVCPAILEKQLSDVGLSLIEKTRIAPEEDDSIGGVYLYLWKK